MKAKLIISKPSKIDAEHGPLVIAEKESKPLWQGVVTLDYTPAINSWFTVSFTDAPSVTGVISSLEVVS